MTDFFLVLLFIIIMLILLIFVFFKKLSGDYKIEKNVTKKIFELNDILERENYDLKSQLEEYVNLEKGIEYILNNFGKDSKIVNLEKRKKINNLPNSTLIAFNSGSFKSGYLCMFGDGICINKTSIASLPKITYTARDNYLHIEDIEIEHEDLSKGYGTFLMNSLIKESKKHNIDIITGGLSNVDDGIDIHPGTKADRRTRQLNFYKNQDFTIEYNTVSKCGMISKKI